uniref:RPTOR independent companion of MTOR complex 2 n=1 Tax=Meleagris gallopavo TaxID=9103 RepID=G1MWK2_MELGA
MKHAFIFCYFRCIDIQQSNEVERTQALRLVRKMITVNASLFPSSITNSLIAVGNDGLQERDRMVRACIAIICELALQNPEVVALRGGLSTILKNVIDCQLSRINEALITTVLHLINHPKTRQYVRADVELERILAPYTDFHYRHNPDTAEGQLKEDREARFLASKMGIVAAFRSWAGIISLCKPGNSGIQSLIGVLCIPNMEIRRGLLEVLYDIFRLPLPVVSEEFIEALLSVDPSRFQDCWRLSDGFVAAEAKTILPHRARSRPDLMDNYLALVLSAFITNGLLEGLVEVITSSDDHVSVRATILLGELLHMVSKWYGLHFWPNKWFCFFVTSFIDSKESTCTSAALNCLKRFHEMKKRGPKPYSLHLDHIIQKAISTHQKRDQYRVQKDIVILKDTEEALVMNLRDSQVLNHKENLEWNWNLIGTILKWPNVNLRNYKDEQLQSSCCSTLYFYLKVIRLFLYGVSNIRDTFIDGQGYLEELVKDIVNWLNSSSGMKPERSLQNNGLLNTLSQHYFLFFGTLSCHPHGVKMLEKCNVFQCLLNLCSLKNQDHLLKLTVSSLDYSRDGLARVILSKILTAATDSCRLYATKHLRVLLRANVEFFSNWGIELLVTQLHDKNKTISSEALDILDEACEDKANLHALIQMKPALSHLGDKGLLLLLRFLSIPKGFSYLNERGYVTKQMEKWQKEYNLKYVELIEEQLNEALTTYRKPVDGDNYVRRSNQRLQRPHVYLPVHLYGQLVHHKTGCHLLESQSIVTDLSYTVRSPMLDKWEGIKHLASVTTFYSEVTEQNPLKPLFMNSSQKFILNKCIIMKKCLFKRQKSTCSRCTLTCFSSKEYLEFLMISGMFIMEDDRFGSTSTSTFFLDITEDAEQIFYDRPGPSKEKDRSPFPFFSSSRIVKNRILNSLTLPNKKHRSSSDPKGGKLTSSDSKSSLRRNRTFQKIQTLPTETSMCLLPTKEDTDSTPSIGENDLKLPKGLGNEIHRENTSRERLIGDGTTQTHFKSRSLSFNTDTTTSGISSMSSSPSRETVGVDTTNVDTDCGSLSTVVSTKTVKPSHCSTPQSNHLPLSKSNSVSLVPPGSSHTLPRRAQSLKAPSLATIKSLADYNFSYTSSRDAFGYATLKRLQQQRMHPSLSHSEALASPAKDVLFTDTITMKSGSLDSRLTPSRFMKALSYASLDKEDLLSPINQNTLQRSSSVRSMVSNATYGSSDDYIGLALPVDINEIFQVKETPYFQKKTTPPFDDRGARVFAPEAGGLPSGTSDAVKSPFQMLRQQITSNFQLVSMLAVTILSVLGYCIFNIEKNQVRKSMNNKDATFCFCQISQTFHILTGVVKSIPDDTPVCRILLRKEVLRLVINLSSSVGTKGHETGLLT